MDHCIGSRTDFMCCTGTVCSGYAKIQESAETGRQTESGDQRNSDRASGYSCV